MANATQTIAGDIQLAGDLAGNNTAASPALTTVLDGTTGKVPGSYVLASITVDGKGRVTGVNTATPAQVIAQVPAATATSKGAVQIGSGLTVDSNGVVSVNTIPDATSVSKGIVQIDPTTMIVSSGTISIPVASPTQYGAIKVGGGLTITNGVLSANAPVIATTTTVGVVKVGAGLAVDGAGNLTLSTVSDATTGTKGIVQIGSGLSVTSGVVSAPIATTTTVGVVKVGAGLAVDGAGNLTLSAPDATTSTKGIVQIGDGLAIASGVVSAPFATTGTKGIVQPGVGLEVTNGILAVVAATNAIAGVVKSADTANITITAGAINVGSNIPLINANNVYTKSQCVTPVALTSGTNIAVDATLSNVYTLTMTGNGTLTNPTGLVAGNYQIIIKQDATGSRTLAYGTAYKFVGSTPSLTTTANATDMLVGVSDGTNIYCTLYKNFA